MSPLLRIKELARHVRTTAQRRLQEPDHRVRRLDRKVAGRAIDISWHLAPTARVGDVLIEGWGKAQSHITVGEGSRIEDGVLIRLRGGADVVIGPRVVIRRGSILNVAGRLEFQGDNLLSWGSVVHAGEDVTFAAFAGTGEMITVVDGAHYRDRPGDHWYKNSKSAPVTIGENSWLAARSTVTSGVRIGRDVTVAAGSVVTKDVQDGCIVGGVPAKVIGRQFEEDGKS